MSSTSTSTVPSRPHRRLLGVVVTIVSIVIFIAAGQLVGSDEPGAFAVLLCGILTVGAVIGAAAGLAVATARRHGHASSAGGAPAGPGDRRRAGAVTLVVGVALAAAYWVVRALGIAGIGAPTDIGGGVIQLATYAVTAVGAFLSVASRR